MLISLVIVSMIVAHSCNQTVPIQYDQQHSNSGGNNPVSQKTGHHTYLPHNFAKS